MTERYVLHSAKGFLMPNYDREGGGVSFTDLVEKATKFVTVEYALHVARQLSLQETVSVVLVLV